MIWLWIYIIGAVITIIISCITTAIEANKANRLGIELKYNLLRPITAVAFWPISWLYIIILTIVEVINK